MEKWIAGFLQASSAFMFFAAGAFGHEAVLLLGPAAVSGISGLLLWNRTRKEAPVLPPTREPRPLEAKVDRIEDTLAVLQSEIAHLREDREFFRELYVEQRIRPELKA